MTTLKSEVQSALRKARTGSILWSVAHHGSGIASILSSAAAGFIAATNDLEAPGSAPAWIAAFSGAAATLTAISTFAGCAAKWRTNRKTRAALQVFQLELRGEETDSQRKRFSNIMEAHERGIIGAAETT